MKPEQGHEVRLSIGVAPRPSGNSSPPGSGAAHNPFSSERVRPGAIPPVLPDGVTAASLFAACVAAGGSGQLLGPHGSGKSALLHHLVEHARELGWSVERLVPDRPGEAPAAWHVRTLIVLDGADQLARRRWAQLQSRCARAGSGLLVTSHRCLSLPWTWKADVTVDILDRIVCHLLVGWGVPEPSRSRLTQLLDAHQGNARLVLFALYDWYESLRT